MATEVVAREVCKGREDCGGCGGCEGCEGSEVKGSTSDVSTLSIHREFGIVLPIRACSLRNGTVSWITIGIRDPQMANLPLCPSSCDCNCILGCISDSSLRSRMYCRRQRMKRRMNPVRTATEAITSAAMTAGWSDSPPVSWPRDISAGFSSELGKLDTA